jgi:sugar lactone lactonase YvrE
MPTKNDKDDDGNSGLFKYDLTSGKLLSKYILRKDSVKYFMNDLVLDEKGTPYIADTRAGKIYVVNPATDSLQLFLDLPKQYRPNGIDITPDNKYLFVALYTSPKSAFARIDVLTKELTIIQLPPNWPAGADGLYYYNKSLIAILPGATQNRIIQYFMNDDMTAITDMKVHVENDPLLSQPTTGVIVKGKLYFIATSNLQRFARMYRENGGVADLRQLQPVRIGEIALK